MLAIDRLVAQGYLSAGEAHRLHELRRRSHNELLSTILNAQQIEQTEIDLDLPRRSLKGILWALSLDPTPKGAKDEEREILVAQVDYLQGLGDRLAQTLEEYPKLSGREGQILTLLQERSNRVLTFTEAADRLHGINEKGPDDVRGSISVQICTIKRKYPNLRDRIVSIMGVGYKWLGDD